MRVTSRLIEATTTPTTKDWLDWFEVEDVSLIGASERFAYLATGTPGATGYALCASTGHFLVITPDAIIHHKRPDTEADSDTIHAIA